MKTLLLTTGLLLGLGLGGGTWVSAQTPPAAKAKPPAAHVHGGPPAAGGGISLMSGGMGVHGGMGMYGGMGMHGGLCAMAMGAADTKVEVKNVDKGVTITITSADAAKVTRLQKMAEAMRLMHEATAP